MEVLEECHQHIIPQEEERDETLEGTPSSRNESNSKVLPSTTSSTTSSSNRKLAVGGSDEDKGEEDDEDSSEDDEVKLLFSTGIRAPVFTEQSVSVFETIRPTHDYDYYYEEDGGLREEEGVDLNQPQKLTRAQEYRTFMELSMSITTLLMETIERMQTSILNLTRKVTVLDDPACGEVSIWKAWMWMIEESLCLTGKSGSVTPTNKKWWKMFVKEEIKGLNETAKGLERMVDKFDKHYSKVRGQIKKLRGRSISRLSSNIVGGETKWETEEKGVIEGKLRRIQVIEWINPIRPKEGNKVMRLRWDLNGVMFKESGNQEEGCGWMKLNSLKELEDRKLLIHNIFKGAENFVKDVTKMVGIGLKILSKKTLKEDRRRNTVLGQVKMLANFVGGERMKLTTLYPSEEAEMFCATLRNLELFEKVGGYLKSLKGKVGKYLRLAEGLGGRGKEVAKGWGRRMPLDKWSQLNLEVEVEGSGLDKIILGNMRTKQIRNNNVEDASGEDETEEDTSNKDIMTTSDSSMKFINEPSFPIYGGSGAGGGESVEEFDMKRDDSGYYDDQRSVEQTCFLFNDQRTQYQRLGRVLLQGKPLGSKDIELCRDSIKIVGESVKVTEKNVEEAKKFLFDGLESLTQTEPSQGSTSSKTFPYLQILHKSLDTWDISTVELKYKRKLTLANGQLMERTTELENTIRNVLQLFFKQQKELKHVDKAVKLFREVGRIRKILSPYEVGKSETDDEDVEDENSSSSSGGVVIRFINSEMEIIIMNNKSAKSQIFLKNLPQAVQADIICVPIFQQIRIINKVILNLSRAQEVLERLQICDIWENIGENAKAPHRTDFKKLESIVLAILINTANSSVSSMSPVLMSLGSNIDNFTRLIGILQLHVQGEGDKWRIKKIMNEQEQQSLIQFFKDIPDEFEISDSPMAREYKQLIDRALGGIKKGSGGSKHSSISGSSTSTAPTLSVTVR